MRILLIAALAIAAPLGACSSITQAVKGPQLAPMGYPSMLVGQDQTVASLASVREPAPSFRRRSPTLSPSTSSITKYTSPSRSSTV